MCGLLAGRGISSSLSDDPDSESDGILMKFHASVRARSSFSNLSLLSNSSESDGSALVRESSLLSDSVSILETCCLDAREPSLCKTVSFNDKNNLAETRYTPLNLYGH